MKARAAHKFWEWAKRTRRESQSVIRSLCHKEGGQGGMERVGDSYEYTHDPHWPTEPEGTLFICIYVMPLCFPFRRLLSQTEGLSTANMTTVLFFRKKMLQEQKESVWLFELVTCRCYCCRCCCLHWPDRQCLIPADRANRWRRCDNRNSWASKCKEDLRSLLVRVTDTAAWHPGGADFTPQHQQETFFTSGPLTALRTLRHHSDSRTIPARWPHHSSTLHHSFRHVLPYLYDLQRPFLVVAGT